MDFKKLICLILIAMNLCAVVACDMGEDKKYEDVYTYLQENPIYYSGGDEYSVSRITFVSDEDVKVETVSYSEDGTSKDMAYGTGTYTVGDVDINIAFSNTIVEVDTDAKASAKEFVVSYVVWPDGRFTFSEGYYTLDQIGSKLEGKWWCEIGTEGEAFHCVYDVEITPDAITYQKTTGAETEDSVSGEYTLGLGIISTDAVEGDVFRYVIDGSKINLYVFNQMCKVRY